MNNIPRLMWVLVPLLLFCCVYVVDLFRTCLIHTTVTEQNKERTGADLGIAGRDWPIRPPLLYVHSDPDLIRENTVSAYAMKFASSRWQGGNKEPIVVSADDDVESVDDRNKRVPPIIHFVLISNPRKIRYSLIHYLALRAAFLRLNPAAIYLHVDIEPTSTPYWLLMKPMISKLVIWKNTESVPNTDLKMKMPEHRSDVLRIRLLQKYGGIYFDSDIVALKSFDDLLGNPQQIVLGQESEKSLGNGLIISGKRSKFLKLWMDVYRNDLKDEIWGYNSVLVAKTLSLKYPDTIRALPVEAFYKTAWDKPDLLFKAAKTAEQETNLLRYDGSYCIHLAEHVNRVKHMSRLTPAFIILERNPVNQVLRPLLPNPYISLLLAEPVSLGTLDSIRIQTFPLWEVVIGKSAAVSCGTERIRCGDDVVSQGVWRVSVPTGTILPPAYLEEALDYLTKNGSFEYRTQTPNMTIQFNFRM